MGRAGHPFILGSECDILHVSGSGETIRKKVAAFLGCRCEGPRPIRRYGEGRGTEQDTPAQ